jgi:U3 small nucleolar RNA-associated protein 14
MENLIKPADYAKQLGISRQAVYAKIKKGLLPSKNVEGKIYIVLENEAQSTEQKTQEPSQDGQALLAAKDETIAVLKETIRDLKETNQMITSTLRSEVELLKEAFGEMKNLYAARLEQLNAEAYPTLEEVVGGEAESEEALEREEEKVLPGWVTPEEFLAAQGIERKKSRKAFVKQVKKLYKKGDRGVDKTEEGFRLRTDKAVEILQKLEKP